jgi:formylglycine-generating enzyme required for sulfatase activity
MRGRVVAVSLGLALGALAWSGEGAPSVEAPLSLGMSSPGDRAVVIGIEAYDAMTRAPYAASDAAAFAKMLRTTRGMSGTGQVLTVMDGQATRSGILGALAAAGKATSGTVWVYFSGHGSAHPGCDGAQSYERCDPSQKNDRLLLPVEVRPDAASIRSTGISVEEVRRVAGAGGATVMVVTDACYTGSARDGAALTTTKLAMFAEEAGPAEWSAASAGETARPLPQVGHGAFTWALLGAARGWADGADGTPRDRKVTLGEANAYATQALQALGIYDQTPELQAGSTVGASTVWVAAGSGSAWEAAPDLSAVLARPVASAPEGGGAFTFDASGLASTVQSSAARQAELEAAAKEASCQKEALDGADAKQAAALKAALGVKAGEVDAAWRGVLASLEACRALEDMSARTACATQASAFADAASKVEATVPAASFSVGTACGARSQAVGSRKALVESARVGEARKLAAELSKARVVGVWESPTLGTMRLIPAGTFTMGCKPGRDDVAEECESNETPHTVTLSKAYYMMEHEVTQGEWQAVMGSNPSAFTSCGDRCPVENVSWRDARAFIAKVSARDGVTYRLPTEAEWEWAARGGQDFAYAGSNEVGAVAWVDGNSGDTPHPVCGKQRNGYGLCDMTGNVDEWVGDLWGDYGSASVTDPRGPASGSGRVSRGGSWTSYSRIARVAARDGCGPDFRFGFLGLRLVRSSLVP